MDEKILLPLEKRLGRELAADHIVDLELGKITNHHEEGKIWKCEANITIPHRQATLYAMSLSESLEGAIDETKDEIEREAMDFKTKRSAQYLRAAREIKERSRVSRLAQTAGDFYRWFKKK